MSPHLAGVGVQQRGGGGGGGGRWLPLGLLRGAVGGGGVLASVVRLQVALLREAQSAGGALEGLACLVHLLHVQLQDGAARVAPPTQPAQERLLARVAREVALQRALDVERLGAERAAERPLLLLPAPPRPHGPRTHAAAAAVGRERERNHTTEGKGVGRVSSVNS